MNLSVVSEDKRVEVHLDTSFDKDYAFMYLSSYGSILRVPVKHSDIDSVIDALQKYKERMTEVLGADSLK
ncbi:MAG: hypothetical protein PHF25_09480 [Candidatus Margulisbacteria bacterium]|nr:hypothetical protein [Candidatus Margulisiibacteriota bacterium]